MPKVSTKGLSKQPTIAVQPVQKQEPKSPPVFRLFECVIHLEIALAELKKVGLYPGPHGDAESLQRQHKEVTAQVNDLYVEYLKQWGSLPKP